MVKPAIPPPRMMISRPSLDEGAMIGSSTLDVKGDGDSDGRTPEQRETREWRDGGKKQKEIGGIEAREHLPYTAYGRADGADVRPSSSPNRMAGLSVSLALQQELDMVVMAWRPFVGPDGTELSDMQKGSAAPDGAVALHANRCRRAARGR